MSLTSRIAVAIIVLVSLTAMLAYAVSARVWRPFVEDVHAAYLAEVAFIGERIDRGSDPRHLGRVLRLKIHPFPTRIPPRWREQQIGGRTLYRPPGPRNAVVVQTNQGLFRVSHEIDFDRPGRSYPWFLAIVVVVVISLAIAIARRSVRPIGVATAAMGRMAAGDLEHRLAAEGPRELQDAARSFNTLADRIQHMLQSERQLMAGISHELRTPLTRLRLELELLRDAGVPDDRIGRMEADVLQLDALVGEALALSRLQLGQAPLNRTPTDLVELVHELVLPQRHPVTISGSGTAHIDGNLAARAIQNLVDNAAKYTPEGTVIEIHVAPDTVTVRDHGPGVPAGELAALFEPFYRTESGSRRAEGHGLGLMIARQVSELHGGTATASDASPGLSVTLRFAG